MVEDAPTEADLKLPRRLGLVLVVVTALFTITSFRIAERDLIDLDKSVFIFLPPLLFVIGLSTVALFRGIVLPEMARNSQISQPLRFKNCMYLSYAAAQAMGVYGITSSVYLSEGWVSLPFAATALPIWVFLSRFSASQIKGHSS